jgi:FolB domain-containing protein
MDRIFIHELEAHGVIGVHEWERQAPQRILMDVSLEVDITHTARRDALGSDSLDYAQLADSLRRLVEERSRYTLEALAEDLAALCLQHPGVQRVHLRVTKPCAVPASKGAGIEIERSRER